MTTTPLSTDVFHDFILTINGVDASPYVISRSPLAAVRKHFGINAWAKVKSFWVVEEQEDGSFKATRGTTTCIVTVRLR